MISAIKSGKVNHAAQVSPVRVTGHLAHGSAFRTRQKGQRRGAERNDGYGFSSLEMGITGFGLLTDRETEIVEALADLVDPMDEVHAAVADALDEVRS